MFTSIVSKTAVVALAMLTMENTVEARASKEDRLAYRDINYAFAKWGNNVYWKSYEVTTDTGYELTMFHIEGLTKKKRVVGHGTKGPLLLIHGYSSDGLTWFNRSDKEKSVVATQLYEEGFDVWIANIRGTRYSRTHRDLDPAGDEYWDFDFSNMAKEDLPAMIEKIFWHHEADVGPRCRKVTLVGHSQGGQMIVNALA